MTLDIEKILDFIKSSPHPVKKNEIARAFKVKGEEPRVELKRALKQLTKEDRIERQRGGTFTVPSGLPPVCIVEITEIDSDGDMFGTPTDWDHKDAPPRIEIMPGKKGHPPLLEKDRALVRITRSGDGVYEGKIIRKIGEGSVGKSRIIGIYRNTKNGGIIAPTHKKAKYDYEVKEADKGDAKNGDLVIGEMQPSRGLKMKRARVVEILGSAHDPKAISLLSMTEVGMHEAFPKDVIKETEGLKVPELKKREDLRKTPLITIDGADARDFDDAVFAEKTDNGFHLIVAIADVSHYVRHGSKLNTEAQRRGNSTYFPDRVVPMLPEALSNNLCSLRPNEPRACLAMHLYIDEQGNLKKHKITRALMQSHARLTYEQVQHQKDTGKGEHLDLINPLYEAYAILDKARQKRGALDLDLPERQIIIDDNNEMTGVKIRERLDSHKLIEEFMVLANVAAATAIEAKRNLRNLPCVYRIHDRPSPEKLDSARDFLKGFDLSLQKGSVTSPEQINTLLRKGAQTEYSQLISIVLLRTQSQAVYSTDNIGHFGLALQRYAHFTSPIRRYADLLVHRALISAYGLGTDGLTGSETARIDEICEHISGTERTSIEAERNATDRFTAAYLSDKIGAEFQGKINGVTRFGMFVTLSESGADGLVPMRSMNNDFYVHDEKAHALIGKRKGKVFRLGATVTVKLKECDGLTGSTVFELTENTLRSGADIPGMELKPSAHGGGRNDKRGRGKPFKKKSGYKKKPKR